MSETEVLEAEERLPLLLALRRLRRRALGLREGVRVRGTVRSTSLHADDWAAALSAAEVDIERRGAHSRS